MIKPSCIIVDIDGTLADVSHRQHFVRTKPKNWAAFNAAMIHDKPIPQTIFLVYSIAMMRGYHVVFCSGREDTYRGITEDFLNLHMSGLFQSDRLFMRKAGDKRPDHLIKKEILDHHITPKWHVVCAIDDRVQVTDMWKKNAIFTIDVNQLPHNEKVF